MGLLGDLALGVLDALLSDEDSSVKTAGIIFDSGNMPFGVFSDTDIRNSLEQALLTSTLGALGAPTDTI